MVNKSVEIGLSSKGRLRIIRELEISDSPLSLYMLERRTGLRRKSIRSDIAALLSVNWIIEVKGRVTKYELNSQNHDLMVIVRALKEINYIE